MPRTNPELPQSTDREPSEAVQFMALVVAWCLALFVFGLLGFAVWQLLTGPRS